MADRPQVSKGLGVFLRRLVAIAVIVSFAMVYALMYAYHPTCPDTGEALRIGTVGGVAILFPMVYGVVQALRVLFGDHDE